MTYDIIIMTEGSDPTFGVARALGAYKIASALRNEGYSVFVLNNFTHFMKKGNIKEVLDALIGDNTLWVGFSSALFMRKKHEVDPKRHTRETRNDILWYWPTTDEGMKKMTDYIRSKGVKTVYGGQMDYKRYEDVKDCIDFFVVGMGEIPALRISEHLRDGKHLQYNIAYGSKCKVVDFDIKGDQFDFRSSKINYIPEDFWNPEDAMGIEFGRGCIFKCKFCGYPLIGKKKGDESFLREKEKIKHELQQNYDLFGTTKYVIIDDTFNEQTIKLEAIADAIDELDLPPLQFSAFIRIDLVARFPEQIDLLRRINVCAWFNGIESLNPESAKTIGKGAPKEKIFQTIVDAKKAFNGNLSVYGSFIVGLPYDDFDTIEEWSQELFDRTDVFDAYGFNPLELGTSSQLSQFAEEYGYTVQEGTDRWISDNWTSDEVYEYAKELMARGPKTKIISTFFLMFYQTLGFTFDELKTMTYQDIHHNPDLKPFAKEYMDRSYYHKVERHLGLRDD